MTTAVSTTYLTPCAQIQQVCNAIGSLFSSLTESTDAAFKRVHVTKKDENGNIRLFDKKEKVIDPQTGASRVVITKISVLTYIEDVKTGELYLDETPCIVSTKCALVTLVMPVYAVAKRGWHVLKTPLEIGCIAVETLQHFFSGDVCEAAKRVPRKIIQIFEVLGTGLFEFIKAPLFMLGCELAAIYGIFKPYHGRKFEALIENAWQCGASHKLDFRKINARPNENCLTAFVKDVLEPRPFHLAHCFQVRGSTRDPRVTVTSSSPL